MENIETKNQAKYFPLLCMIFLTLDLTSYLYVYYIVGIFDFIISCSVIFFTATYMIADIVVEIYGYRYARKMIWFGLACEGIFAFSIYIFGHVHFSVVHYNNHENTLLADDILWIFFTSLITTPIGDFINSYAISKWKILLKGKYFIFRSISSTALGIIIYCLITQTMLFHGVLDFKKLATLIGSSILFKLICVLISSIPANIIMLLLKRAEHSDHFDYNISYNPFKIT